jgi:hypothetical protein
MGRAADRVLMDQAEARARDEVRADQAAPELDQVDHDLVAAQVDRVAQAGRRANRWPQI